MHQKHLTPTWEAGRKFMERHIEGSVLMLNLLKFRDVADYSCAPELAPPSPITGQAAYGRYVAHTLPFLEASGGEVVFYGRGGHFLIGPDDERWDAVLLVRQTSVESFLAFESNIAYMRGIGHRTAALEDARLLPMTDLGIGKMLGGL